MVEQAVRQRVDLPEATEPQRPPTNYPFPSEKKETHPFGEEILSQQGSFRRVRKYYPGWFAPESGTAGVDYWWHEGWRGKETVVEKTVIVPIQTFEVQEKVEPLPATSPKVEPQKEMVLAGR